jgi:hypothetical protein
MCCLPFSIREEACLDLCGGRGWGCVSLLGSVVGVHSVLCSKGFGIMGNVQCPTSPIGEVFFCFYHNKQIFTKR